MKKHISIIRFGLCAVLTLISGFLYAQSTVTVTGTVTDESGEPITGAAVMLEGSTTGVVTDISGKYSITFVKDSEKEAALVFSSISYASQTVVPGKRTVVDIVLEEDHEELDEVVVVGYGAMRKSDITGSVASVKIDEGQADRSASLDQLLRGQAAGVQVISSNSSPDAAVSVVIRGASSFNSNSQPLYVVDGVIVNTSGTVAMGGHGGTDSGIYEENNGLIGISPQDIASMEILKDASATAIYGSQGANGVILITTKSASKSKPVVSFSGGVSISTISKRYDLMDADDYVAYLDMKGVSPNDRFYSVFTTGVEAGTYTPVDWQDYVTRPSVTQRYFLSVSGRPKQTNFRFSLGYNDNEGIVKKTGYRNIFARINLDKTIGKFELKAKNAVSWLDSRMTQGVGSSISQTPASSLVVSMLTTRPLRPVVEYDDEGLELNEEGAASYMGPDVWLYDHESNRKEFRVTSSISGEYKILPWLSFRSTFGADFRMTERTRFKTSRLNGQGTGSHGATGQTQRLNWNWDNLLLAEKELGKHRISGTLGHTSFSSFTKSMTVEGTNVVQYKAMSASLNSAPYAWLSYSESKNQLLSFFARAVYSYDDRYILTATHRLDGSSKFAAGNKWAQFPSFAVAWRINNEPWFWSVKALFPGFTSAKLRLGWGMVGNQGIPSYQTSYRYSSSGASTHDNVYNKIPVLSSFSIPSRDLKWETTYQYNAGLDLDFFKGRLVLSVDGYYKLTKDLLQTRLLAASAGVYNPYVNMGSISNTGLEISLNTVPVTSRNWEWTLGGNFSLNRNKILSIDPSGAGTGWKYVRKGEPLRKVEYFVGEKLSSSAINADYLNVFFAGEPMGLFYGLATDGIVQEGETMDWTLSDGVERRPGSVKFVDTNGDGIVNSYDKVVIGDPNPDFTYGFDTSLRFKGLSLALSFVGSYGNDVYNQQLAILTDLSTNSANRLRAPIFDCWSPENTDSKWPAVTEYNSNDVYLCSDRFVEDGSYLRLANASLSYSVPFRNRQSFVRGLTFTASCRNVWCWTDYSGYDPDVNVYGTVLKYGIDMGSYPAARTFMFDVKITF